MTAQPKSPLVTLTQPRSALAESFRTLRANLLLSSLEKPLTTLLVTSAAHEAGKSRTLANLAVSLAQGGRKTVLVDCDLRRPSQHTLFSTSGDRGLTRLLMDGDPATLPLVDVGVPNLALLPAGPLPPNPADLLSSRRMEQVIAALRSRADLVLFDAPPLLAVADGMLLASKLDGVLLVMTAGSTRRDHAQRAKEMLEKIHVRVVGAVLTNTGANWGIGPY